MAQPAYTLRAKTGRKDEQERDIMVTVGVAFPFKRGDGFMLNINTLPVPFDGSLMMVPPKED